jgi:hypothetical protein
MFFWQILQLPDFCCSLKLSHLKFFSHATLYFAEYIFLFLGVTSSVKSLSSPSSSFTSVSDSCSESEISVSFAELAVPAVDSFVGLEVELVGVEVAGRFRIMNL